MSDNQLPLAPPVMDGGHHDGMGDSPASSTGTPSYQRQKQVAISRNIGSGYERPERARTSHACEPCRERKTKCDGERPSCRRCLHTGTGCHYGYGKGWKKRKTAEDLTVTTRKLARYEELLHDIFPLVPDNVRGMIDSARQQDWGPIPALTSNESTDSFTPDGLQSIDSEFRGSSPSLNRLPRPAPVSLTQSAPPFTGAQRPLPPPLSVERSHSPLLPASSIHRTSGSPTDDVTGTSLVRLPSITRHGFLVDGVLRNNPMQASVGLGQDVLGSTETQGVPTASREITGGEFTYDDQPCEYETADRHRDSE